MLKYLWEDKDIKERILDLYFKEGKTSNQIFKIISKENNINFSNTKTKKDIGRIIHRKSEDFKLNRIDGSIGICPICKREVFLRDRTKQNEKFSCICSGVYENKCYFRITKNAYGIPLYNSILKQLLENKKTKLIKNLSISNDKKTNGYLVLDIERPGFIKVEID